MDKNSPVLRVLIVEDESLIRWSIAETLSDAGHHVVAAPDGKAAVSALHETREPIDVVLLDYRLPDSDDWALLSDIRRLSPTSSVVLMTADGTPEIMEGALALGVWRVVRKPFDMRDVTPLVLQAHRSREMHPAIPLD